MGMSICAFAYEGGYFACETVCMFHVYACAYLRSYKVKL